MAVSKLVPAVSGAAPVSLNRPIFTYNTGYTNAFASQSINRSDATYNPSDSSIVWANNNSSGSNGDLVKFNINTNTFSLISSVFPNWPYEQYEITAGSDGTLAYIYDKNTSTNLPYYRSLDNGSTWSSISSVTYLNCLFPMPSNLRTPLNNSDSVPFGVLHDSSSVRFWNRTANSNYAGSIINDVGYAGNTANGQLWKKALPIRKGDDSFDINGYFLLDGHSNTAGPSGGTRHLMTVTGEDKRNNLFFGRMPYDPQELATTAGTSTYANVMFYNVQGQTTCIENRWFLTNTNAGFYLFDFLTKSVTQAPIPSVGRGYYTTRPIYISSTKKLYIYNGNSKTMNVLDVTFE